jgi:hypothetical protein
MTEVIADGVKRILVPIITRLAWKQSLIAAEKKALGK